MTTRVSTLVYQHRMEKDNLEELLIKYKAGTCTQEERQAVEKWYASYEKQEEMAGLTEQQNKTIYTNIVDQLTQEGEWNASKNLPRRRRRIFRWVAAAAIIGLLAGSIYFWSSSRQKETSIANREERKFSNDIEPGGNKAILLLADGSTIILDSLANGKIASQGNASIMKLNTGQLSYQHTGKNTEEIFYNMLSTPRGGQYEILLPDGSKAWLNAASSLRFPTVFSGKERIVELTGEGYFEIAKNKDMPFKVKVNDMEVEVLGTHFNVMSYNNEQAVKTTLLEGLVKISKAEMTSFLKPGQQATILPGKNNILIANADTDEAIAWKNKLFWFHDADIKTVMRQLDRWYDVDVIFEGTVTKRFKGSIPMNLSAIKVFTILEATGGVHFRIEGKKIFVLP